MADLKYLADVKYTRSDEWIKVSGDEATIGVTDYAQNALSDVVFVELPSAGEMFTAGEPFGTVESVKAASEMHMPIGGTITAVNQALEDTPEQVNKAPYDAWFVRIKPSNLTELDSLLDMAAYKKFCEERG